MTTDGPGASASGRRRTRLAVLLLAATLTLVPLWKAVQYAADPGGQKDCGPVVSGGNTDKPTRLQATVIDRLTWAQVGGTINDASCLNRTPVYGIIQIRSADDVKEALRLARVQGLKVAIAGVRHSMGGQAFARGALVLDMNTFNRMSLNESERVLTVQSGATWHDIQSRIHPRFAVKAMQSTDIFSVGGSISVNAHGMDHQAGSVGRTIRAMRVMMPDGSVRQLSRTKDPQLFELVVGGYGLFGIILDVDLDVTDNVVYQPAHRVVDYRNFLELFRRDIQPDAAYGLMYGHLSTAPQSFLREMVVYTYRTADAPGAVIPPLGEVSQVWLRRLLFNMSRHGAIGMRLKWFAEKYVGPRLESCTISRNQALGEAEGCFVSRNEPMHDSVAYLRNGLKGETDILQEYFIPQASFVPFVDGLRRILTDGQTRLLNASVRVVHREDNFLTYAPEDNTLAVVLYLSQTTDQAGNEQMAALTRALIDLCAEQGGRFFLPYQLHYSAAQLERSYPNIRAFFAAKREIDPAEVLTNTFYDRYAPMLKTAERPIANSQ